MGGKLSVGFMVLMSAMLAAAQASLAQNSLGLEGRIGVDLPVGPLVGFGVFYRPAGPIALRLDADISTDLGRRCAMDGPCDADGLFRYTVGAELGPVGVGSR